jgi:hypothetical protein
MLKVIFTLDYELHGNGEGSPYELMVEPTERMLDLFERHGAKLTIMADVAEILKFQEYLENHGKDLFHFAAIKDQLRDAIRLGHDVQLHIHSSYCNAKFSEGRWIQDWDEYNLAGLDRERLSSIVNRGKKFLEDLLKPVNSDYSCIAFRAANWSVSPAANVVAALTENSIPIDTSVFKYGHRSGLVNFDYGSAHSDLVPWSANPSDICRKDPSGRIVEFPIYCEKRRLGSFLSANRLYRVVLGKRHQVPKSSNSVNSGSNQTRKDIFSPLRKGGNFIFGKHPWKADFNQCTGRQLIRALLNAEGKYRDHIEPLPFVLIGHSKLFTRHNERSLESFLEFVASGSDRFGFGCFRDFDLESFRNNGTVPDIKNREISTSIFPRDDGKNLEKSGMVVP